MTEKEYYEERDRLIRKHKSERNNLDKQYALESNTVSIGDIISDWYSGETIKVQTINYCGSVQGLPSCIYGGVRLTKKGVPFKNGETAKIYQHRMVK
jgi:hypothetical protein